MVGKATLLVILGFSAIFGIASQYWNRTSTRAIDNFVDYYNSTAAHDIAVSAANIGADSLFVWQSYKNLDMSGSFSNGRYSVRTTIANINGINYSAIVAVGSYPGRSGVINDTVRVLLKSRSFNEYAFFSVNENNTNWITKDTLWGPFHTQGEIFVSGKPVFYGKVTNLTPKFKSSWSDKPYFYGGYQSGVSVEMPTDVSASASLATKIFANNDTYSGDTYDVYMTFNSDGTVTFHTTSVITIYSTNGHPTGTMVTTTTPDTTATLSDLGNVILVRNGDVHVEGVLDGYVTLIAQQGTGKSATATSSNPLYSEELYDANGETTHNGNVLIGGNLTYKDNPMSGPSNDMLGLVADNSVALTTQPSAADVTIDAALFARQGQFLYLDWDGKTHNRNMGTLRVYGSITNQTRGPVGTFSGTSTIQSGYQKNYRYDDRFYSSSPPAFPGTGSFEIVAWRE